MSHYDGICQAATDYINGLHYCNPFSPTTDAYTGYAHFCHMMAGE